MAFSRTACARCGNTNGLSRSHAPQRFIFRTLSNYGQSPKKYFPPRPMPRLCRKCHAAYTDWERNCFLRTLAELAMKQLDTHTAYLKGAPLPNV